MNVTVSPASSAFIVIASSLPAHFNIFACEEFKIKPAKLVSQLHRTRPPRARAPHRAPSRAPRVRARADRGARAGAFDDRDVATTPRRARRDAPRTATDGETITNE